jgi:alpha-tubulin suppressor-like RCC1 family protein
MRNLRTLVSSLAILSTAVAASGCAISTADPPAAERSADTHEALFILPVAVALSVAENDRGCIIVNRGGFVYCWTGPYEGTGYGLTGVSLPLPATSIATGTQHACAVLSDNTVWCWGSNTYGQLGNLSKQASATPVQVMLQTQPGASVTPLLATQVSATSAHTCAVTTDYHAACWGLDMSGQLGNASMAGGVGVGYLLYSDRALYVDPIGFVTNVSAGQTHTCAVNSWSQTYCWGANESGQIGIGTVSNYVTSPSLVSGMPAASLVAAGSSKTCASGSSGAYCWGSNFDGSAGIGDSTTYSFASPKYVTWVPATNLAAGYYDNCGIYNGYAYCSGLNSYNALGTNPQANPWLVPVLPFSQDSFVQVASGLETTCARTSNGRVQCVGAGNATPVNVF